MAQNIYGDSLENAISTKGVDISSQRFDDLDQKFIEFVCSQPYNTSADVGCGFGAVAKALAKANQHVYALDLSEIGKEAIEASGSKFYTGDFRLTLPNIHERFDGILCQRTIHYLPYKDALDSLRLLRSKLKKTGKLFISSSGVFSELGTNYEHVSLEERYSPLDIEMQKKHHILDPVCLYSLEEFTTAISSVGFQIETAWVSDFGNNKVIARVDANLY